MASPRWKIYVRGRYQAACRDLGAAAALMAFYGEGTIRDNHAGIMWLEGRDGRAADSYDRVAEVVYSRVRVSRHLRGAHEAGGKG